MSKKNEEIVGFPGMSAEQAAEVLDERRRRRQWKKVPKTMHKAVRFRAAGLGIVTNSGIPVPADGLKIAVIPDVQAQQNVPIDHLAWCGHYLARKKPDVIVCIGDFWDMPSLNEHVSELRRAADQTTYVQDLDAGRRAMELLMEPIYKTNGWSPHLVYTLGNHEDRITRTAMNSPRLAGLLDVKHLELESYGWKVYPFLEPVSVGGVAFCHYFPSGIMGRPITTARELLNKWHMSAFAGHQQGKDIAFSRRGDGVEMGAIIAGSFYQHDENYLSPLTNRHWRGCCILHEVRDGSFDEMFVSIKFLEKKFKSKYGQKSKKKG